MLVFTTLYRAVHIPIEDNNSIGISRSFIHLSSDTIQILLLRLQFSEVQLMDKI